MASCTKRNDDSLNVMTSFGLLEKGCCSGSSLVFQLDQKKLHSPIS
jgi:hypothetical protein